MSALPTVDGGNGTDHHNRHEREGGDDGNECVQPSASASFLAPHHALPLVIEPIQRSAIEAI